MKGNKIMAELNEKTVENKKIIHLMITNECNRNCPDCCNKQYNLSEVEIITTEELSEAETIFITGGEPFICSLDPCGVAVAIKEKYPNIKKVMVYSNAFELALYLKTGGKIRGIDGITISIKNKFDKDAFENVICKNKAILNLESNWLYTFPGFENTKCPKSFVKKMRFWQKEFKPATDSIFRRLYDFE